MKLIAETGFGNLYESGKKSGRIFVYQAPTAGSGKATICSWDVADISATAKKLQDAGVEFEHYDFPGAKHEGVVHIMGGNKGAWFRDPSGNILGLSEMK